jgi:hypothetical protein
MVRRILLLAFVLTACDNKDIKPSSWRDGDREAALRENLDLNLKKVRAFFVQSPAAGETTPSSTPCQKEPCPSTPAVAKLVAVNDDGTTVEVQVTESALYGFVQPRGVVDTPSYLFFMYEGVQYKGTPCSLIPVRKSDGVMFCVNMQMHCGDEGLCPNNRLEATADGKFIYALLQGDKLSRLELNGIADSKQIEISSAASGGLVSHILADNAGNVLATVSKDQQSSQTSDVRYYKAAGGFTNLARGLQNPGLFRGPGDGNTFYWLKTDWDGFGMGSPSVLSRVDTAADPATSAVVFTDGSDLMSIANQYGGFGTAVTASGTYVIRQSAGGMGGGGAANTIVEILNPAETPRLIPTYGFAEINSLRGCAEHLIVAGVDTQGNDVIQRVYPSVPTFETLAATKDFVISKFAVDSACRITFGGRRASDNARIVGQIDPGQDEVKVVAKDLSADVTQILAIH